MNDVLMRNHEHSPCTTCHRQACEGCQEHKPSLLDVARASAPPVGVVAAFMAGNCPSCHHPQHVGKECGADVGAGSDIVCGCPPEAAIKQTKGKVKGWRMFPWEVMGEILGIFQYGIEKGYLKDSWRNVAPEEYEEALMRHATAHLRGEIRDPESGKRHIAHAAWNTIVLLVLAPRE